MVSGFEYSKAIANGVSGDKIIFNEPDKSADDIRIAIQNESLLHIDHYDELYETITIASQQKKRAKVAIGINLDAGTYPIWDRFGFKYENGEAWNAINKIIPNPNLELVGLHTHIGTYILAPTAYAIATSKLAAFAVRIEQKYKFYLPITQQQSHPVQKQCRGECLRKRFYRVLFEAMEAQHLLFRANFLLDHNPHFPEE